MAEFPALPLWTDAYLADTRHLSTLEHGAYFLLLVEAWRRPTCSLPDDDVLLARLAGLSPEQWAASKPIVMAFWKLDRRSKSWTQKRLTKEQGYVRKHSKSQRDKAVKRWSGTKKLDTAALPEPCPDDAPTPTPTTVAEATGAAAPGGDLVKAIFDLGVALLADDGASPKAARSCIGRWRKERGDGWTLQALTDARSRGISAPTAWIEGRLKASAAGPDARRAASRATAERYRRMDAEEGSQGVH